MHAPTPGGAPAPQNDNFELPSDSDERASLVLALGRAFLTLGSPAHRLEAAMDLVANKLGLVAQFFSTPTGLFAALGDGKSQQTFMLRANPGEINLAKLGQINDILIDLDLDRIGVHQAVNRVERTMSAPCIYGPFADFIAFILTAGNVAVLFGGTIHDFILASLLGAVAGILAWLTHYSVAARRGFEPLAATLVSLSAVIGFNYFPAASLGLVTLAGLIVLIPGLSITVATRELATGQLVSGSGRMAGAVTLLFVLIFGVILGNALSSYLPLTTVAPIEMPPLPNWTRWLALLGVTSSFTVLFRSPPKDAIWLFLAAGIALFSGTISSGPYGTVISAATGAVLVGLAGNFLSRLTSKPSATMHMPGLMLLVPGGMSFRGLTSLLDENVIASIQTFFSAILIAVALTTGMLIASIILPPKREL
ncbi:MAG: threonine/serine ThrE exporter family protein [bacterium]